MKKKQVSVFFFLSSNCEVNFFFPFETPTNITRVKGNVTKNTDLAPIEGNSIEGSGKVGRNQIEGEKGYKIRQARMR